MLRNINSLLGYTMGAADGEIGKVEEFYFDDDTWTVRYLVVKTGSWLFGRKVLISPDALIKNSWKPGTFFVNLTMEQIKYSPDIDTDRPVSRAQEMELYAHYPWRDYWGGGYNVGGVWGTTYPSSSLDEKIENVVGADNKTAEVDTHLRSTHALNGYDIHATDGLIGHVADFIINSQTWKVVRLVVNTHNWFGEKKVLVEARHVKEVQWASSEILLNITMADVKNCLPFDEQDFVYPEIAHIVNNKLALQPGWAHL